MAQYKRKLKDSVKWWWKFDHKGRTYFSKAEFETKAKAKKAEAEKLANIKHTASDKITFRELCEARMDLIQTKSDWYYKDHKLVLKPLTAKWGELDVSDIDKMMVSEYLTKLSVDLKKRGKDNYLVNKTIRILKALFRWGIDQDLIDRSPLKAKQYPIDKKKKYIPPLADIKKVLEKCNPEQKNLLQFLMDTGARVGEALRTTDKDFDNGKLILWTRKNKLGNLQPRTIDYTPTFKIEEGKTFKEWNEYPRFLEEKCREAKVKNFGYHSLRHLRASQLIQEGRDIVFIRDYLGHQDVTTTNIYLQSLSGYDLATENSKKG